MQKKGKTNFRLGKGEDNLVEMRRRRGRRFLFPQQTNGSPWTCTLVVPAHYPSRIQQRRAFSGATSSVSGLQSARVSSERDSLRWPTHRRPKWPIDSHSTANDTRFWGFLAEHGRKRRKKTEKQCLGRRQRENVGAITSKGSDFFFFNSPFYCRQTSFYFFFS